MIKFAICDDEKFYTDKLYKDLNEILKKYEIKAEVSVFNNADDLLGQKSNYDIYILDIEMEGTTGIEAAEKINRRENKPIIIFATNYDEYVYSSFELEIFRYMRKSLTDILLERYVIAAVEKLKSSMPKYYVMERREEIVNLPYDDIIYIKKDGKNTVLYTIDDKIYKERTSLNSIYDSLSDERFIYTDRCCIINLNNVKSVSDRTVIMNNDVNLDVSRRKITDVKEKISNYWRKKS